MSDLVLFGSILTTLFAGAVTALKIAIGAFVIAMSGGLLLAVTATFSRVRVLPWIIAAYTEWMRNVPALAHRNET